MYFARKFKNVSVSVRISCTDGKITIGNRYMTGEKVGVVWRLPRFQIGGYVDGSDGMGNGPEMRSHKHNIRIGS